MTAPWKDQPTPLVDKLTVTSDWLTGKSVIKAKDARAIEQRMRHAEALLAAVVESDPVWGYVYAEDLTDAVVNGDPTIRAQALALIGIRAHLAAAREMDGAK